MSRFLFAALAASSLLHVASCTVEATEDLDPAGTLGDEQLGDEAPPDGDGNGSGDTGLEEGDPAGLTGERFQLPFPCGQVWAGQSRTNHSPQLSVDFNRTDDLGDTVVAARSGTVTRVANEGNTSYGRWVEISHGDGLTSRYAHLSVQSVSVGQHVAQGQKIGEVGSTGGSTGPHLHFEERKNGSTIHAVFNGAGALYFGTRNYTSQNGCGGGSNPGNPTWIGRVNTAGPALTVRAGASTSTASVGSVSNGATVTITCQKHGESVAGTYGTSTLWDKIGAGFVADAYVSTGSDGQVAPNCP